MFLKKKMFRSKKLRDSARGESCTLRLPGCQNLTETTVLCHSPYAEHGKAKGLKSEDHYACYGCYNCHQVLDKQYKTPEIRAAFARAMALTQKRFRDKGLNYPEE